MPPAEVESVLFSQFNQTEKTVILTPVDMGPDMETNLEKHLQLFKQKDIAVVSLQLDLGQSSHAGISTSLYRLGFEPKLIIPYGGQGDVVLFQLRSDCS